MGSLSIDREQRYKTIQLVVQRLGLTAEHTVLDVGGGTGALPSYIPTPNFWSCDLRGGGPRHIACSMDRLAVREAAFDLVLQADSLEHIPPERHRQTLDELLKVFRKWLIWIGPVQSDLTVQAEEDLCRTHRELFAGREMNWLIEHRRHGLPDPEMVVLALSRGCQDWMCWRSCRLEDWWLWKQLELALDAGIFRPGVEAVLNNWYLQEGWKRDFRLESGIPAYRMVFVGCRDGKLPRILMDRPGKEDPFEAWRSRLPLVREWLANSEMNRDGFPLESPAAAQLARLAEVLGQQARPGSLWRRWMGG
ncbi:MAG: hypothetical protein KJ050_15640 [Candidatus Omnitrophica bacterium]|nr:hypothetical protein [Candidatus Omnitrophota bacterium]